MTIGRFEGQNTHLVNLDTTQSAAELSPERVSVFSDDGPRTSKLEVSPLIEIFHLEPWNGKMNALQSMNGAIAR